MITFDLACEAGHRFEGWFVNREAFEAQREAKMIACPLCDSRAITKRPSAFAVISSRGEECAEAHAQAAPKPGGERPPAQSFFRELTNFVNANFEDVGGTFADEAIKIKEGEAPARSIRGTTTPEEEEKLTEEGVEFFKVALPKYDA